MGRQNKITSFGKNFPKSSDFKVLNNFGWPKAAITTDNGNTLFCFIILKI